MIVVIGQPRTGTSLAMQMLAAAGADCLGPWPSFEIPFEVYSADNFAGCTVTTAAKYVWHDRPAKPFPPGSLFVVTSRHPKQQQASEAKFLHLFAGMRHPKYINRNQRRLMRRRYVDEQRRIAMFVDQSPRVPTLSAPRVFGIPFEQSIQHPNHTAAELCAFIGFGDWSRVARVVESRDPGNYPGMLEAELLERGQ